MTVTLIDALLSIAGPADDAAAARLLLARKPGVGLPDNWQVRTTGARREEIVAFHRALSLEDAARLAAKTDDADVLTWIAAAEEREPVLRAICANPYLTDAGASAILGRHGHRRRIRDAAIRRRSPRQQFALVAAHPDLWPGHPEALGTIVANHPGGPDQAIRTLLQDCGPRFAADALRAAMTCRATTRISWTAVHAVLIRIPDYDAELDELIGEHSLEYSPWLARKTSTLTYPADGHVAWGDLTWPAARAAALRAMARVAPEHAPPLTAMIAGIEPGKERAVIEVRADFTRSPLAAADLEVLDRHGYGLGTVDTFRHLGCDAAGIEQVATRWPQTAATVIKASWRTLTAVERHALFTAPATAGPVAEVFRSLHLGGREMLDLIAAGIPGADLVRALSCRPGGVYLSPLWFPSSTEPAEIATLPEEILSSLYVNATGAEWEQIFQARGGEVTGQMLGNALGASGHTDTSSRAAVARLTGQPPEVVAAAVHRLLEVIVTCPNRDLRAVLGRLDVDDPILRQPLIDTLVPRLVDPRAGDMLTPLAGRLPMDWGAALDAPVPRRAVLDFIADRYVGDTAGLKAFLGLLPMWTQTLDELADLTATILN